MAHECFKAHPRSLRPAVGCRSRFRAQRRWPARASVPRIHSQRQSARTRADQLELPTRNDGVEEKCHTVVGLLHARSSMYDDQRVRSLILVMSRDDLLELQARKSPSTVSLVISSTPSLGRGQTRVDSPDPRAERIRRRIGPDDRLCHRRAAIGARPCSVR